MRFTVSGQKTFRPKYPFTFVHDNKYSPIKSIEWHTVTTVFLAWEFLSLCTKTWETFRTILLWHKLVPRVVSVEITSWVLGYVDIFFPTATLGEICMSDSACTGLSNLRCKKMYECDTGTCVCKNGYGSTDGTNCDSTLRFYVNVALRCLTYT